jgi:hypothetical protein
MVVPVVDGAVVGVVDVELGSLSRTVQVLVPPVELVPVATTVLAAPTESVGPLLIERSEGRVEMKFKVSMPVVAGATTVEYAAPLRVRLTAEPGAKGEERVTDPDWPRGITALSEHVVLVRGGGYPAAPAGGATRPIGTTTRKVAIAIAESPAPHRNEARFNPAIPLLKTFVEALLTD